MIEYGYINLLPLYKSGRQICTNSKYLLHFFDPCQNKPIPRNLARFRGIFTYARLDSNQRPSESELMLKKCVRLKNAGCGELR